MPYTWIDPVIITPLADNGAAYHIYKDDQLQSGVRRFWFGLDIACSEYDGAYDIRDCPSFDPNLSLKENLIEAYRKGWIEINDDGEGRITWKELLGV